MFNYSRRHTEKSDNKATHFATMAADERLKWMELRINSSLRPRNDDLKIMMSNDDNRLAFYEFINNEDVKKLFVFWRTGRQIGVALHPPAELQKKSVFFLKCNSGTKLTKDNMDSEVFHLDGSSLVLEHLELTIREVFLPLLATNAQNLSNSPGRGDEIMDILHRLMAAVEVAQGQIEGNVVLSLPSIEVLAEAAISPSRRASVLHILETTVIGWMKQIRNIIRHDPQSDLLKKFGKNPGPLDEIHIWERHLVYLQSINAQLDSEVAKDILQNLETANSQYAHSFSRVKKEIIKDEAETRTVLKFLSTMQPLFTRLHTAKDLKSSLKIFKPLMNILYLVWTHSVHYHHMDKFQHLLWLISNEVVHRAKAMIGDDILKEPLESHSKLKEALRMCAAFRGTYLDFKDKADDQNTKNMTEYAERLTAQPQGVVFTTKVYGPHAYKPHYGSRNQHEKQTSHSASDEDMWTDSPWPARNAPCFDFLNSFMERCNDILELVEMTRHFRLLASVIERGGAGSSSFDAMVNEIHMKFSVAMNAFFSQVENVFSIDGTKVFDQAFFNFRTAIKALEKSLSELLQCAFEECPTTQAQLRLMEVFEGISGRELVQANLKDVNRAIVKSFIGELKQVEDIFKEFHISPPCHCNMPTTVSNLMWIQGLKERIQIPMEKIKKVCPHSLEGDKGWKIRDMYTEIMQELDKFEADIIIKWRTDVVSELAYKLKQPLLVADEYDEDIHERAQVIHVNLDSQLLLLLKEIHYLSHPPFCINLPEPAKELLRNADAQDLKEKATRLETVVSKYNAIMKSITIFELPMFERKLAQIDDLLEQGLETHTWKMKESADFIESALSLVCLDVHQNLDIVQTNCQDIVDLTVSWSKETLDIFSARDKTKSYSMNELVLMHKQISDELENIIILTGTKIHSLVQKSFEVVQISQASPAWKDYVDYIDAIVLDGLKQTTLTSLKAMLDTLVKISIPEDSCDRIPALLIRLELIENSVAFNPCLDQSTSMVSVQKVLQTWQQSYVSRGKLVKMLGPKGSYEDYISIDEEVQQLVMEIKQVISDNIELCREVVNIFKEYSFLWEQDTNETFENFLKGAIREDPVRDRFEKRILSDKHNFLQTQAKLDTSSKLSRESSAKSSVATDAAENATNLLLAPNAIQHGEIIRIPSLERFDQEIQMYMTARDEITNMEDYYDIGWIRVDVKPIKRVLTTYAGKWMWTFTKYLSGQVTSLLEMLDVFLKRIEPEIESITGEERDTASFMKMMRLFNEVSAQQSDMDSKFSAMERTVLLLRKYGQSLPEKSLLLFGATPSRWNNLKTKVSLAKQRLGPRIQEESARITQDLEKFAVHVTSFASNLHNSDVYQRECSTADAYLMIESFTERLSCLENEAQDLIELQELLEASIVNFSLLPVYQKELHNLKKVWDTVKVVEEQLEEWKKQYWQKMDTRFLREETSKMLDTVRSLPKTVFSWDAYIGMHESITVLQACLPLIDDLSNPAMRTRHWKQLVRVTGGALTVDSDTLKRMTLKELLSLGLQQHADDVRAIVQRAVKDLGVESSLKTLEEVWLSKVFDLRNHVHNKLVSAGDTTQDGRSESSQSELTGSAGLGIRKSSRSLSHISNQSLLSRNKRNSVSSLPASLLNVEENETSTVMLLTNTERIFEELEHHQIKLQAMQSSSAVGSFLDEVIKWQKKLQAIEAVLQVWLEVQEKWMEMEAVYTSADVCQALTHDANRFGFINKDFKLLMAATEKNSNVLQCCSRKNIQKILENMNENLEICQKSLMRYLERRRHLFPRFYFLSMDDVFHIVCSGHHDLNMLNMYINKLLENVGGLLFEENDTNQEKSSFVITAVQSALGEKLQLDQPVVCEGSIETWLSGLLHQIKGSLQFQLAHILGHEKPLKSKTRTIHSAGARKILVPPEDKDEKTAQSCSSHKNEPLNSSSNPSLNSSLYESQKSLQENEAGILHDMEKRKSWIFEHVTEIVHLATCIEMIQQIHSALDEFSRGNMNALMELFKMIESRITNTVSLLKDLKCKKIKNIADQLKKRQELNSQNSQRRREYTNELEVPVIKSPFHKDFLDTGMDSSYLSPMGEDEAEPRTPDEEASTIAPLDALSQIVPPTDGGRISSRVTAGMDGKDQSENILERQKETTEFFHIQIHKLKTQLTVFAHIRDLMQRLIRVSEHSSPKESFDWKCQLKYNYDDSTNRTSVSCLNAHFDYGFEYLGSSEREVISPVTEKVFVMITQAVQCHMGILCMGQRDSTKMSTVCEISKCLGQAFYMFSCARTTDYSQLQDIFKGLASTGCWVCFNNISFLRPTCLSLLSQLVSTILEALRAAKATVRFQSDDVQLSPYGACFGLLNSDVQVTPRDMDTIPVYPSCACQLPDALLTQFRVVSVTKPDILQSLQILLIRQGFSHWQELAWKTHQLYQLCQNLFTTDTLVSDVIFLGSANSANIYGWSIHSLKCLTEEAGAILESAQTQDLAKDTETELEDAANEKQRQEEDAVVRSLYNSFLPRMTSREASLFASLVSDLWPYRKAHVMVNGEDEDQDEFKNCTTFQAMRAKLGTKSFISQISHRSHEDFVHYSTPIIQLTHSSTDHFASSVDFDGSLVFEDISDAVAAAITDLGLLPCDAFQSRVMQLSQLNVTHQLILVVGDAGCGKSECIKTFAVAQKKCGKQITVQSIFTRAVESDELLGHYDETSREWKDGLLISLLRKFCLVPESDAAMRIMQLDGVCDSYQMEQLHTVLNHTGSVVMADRERLTVPNNLRFVWELESLENMSPSLLATAGVLIMSSSDVGWKLQLMQWVEQKNKPNKELLINLCDLYMEKIIQYITNCTQPAMLRTSKPQKKVQHFQRVISHSIANMIRTFINILEALENVNNDVDDGEYERYFNYAAVWAFGGTLAEEHRKEFSDWWKEQFEDRFCYSDEDNVFDYVVDSESHEFCRWEDIVPPYVGTPSKGIPSDVFVHTVRTEQLLHVLGLLVDAGKSVMLVGENSSGKTSIIGEKMHTLCSGEVTELLSLRIIANRFTNARLLYHRLAEKLEWKHGRTYVPRGNKKLLCFVDDINLSQTDNHGFQSACELIREHLDDGGFYSPTSHMWRYVKGVTYLASVNPHINASTPALSQRLLRHFAIFGCPCPGASELQTIFSTLLTTHFFTPENMTSISATHQPSPGSDRTQNAARLAEQSLRAFIISMVKVTVELSERLRSMFLPTSQRVHYMFTVRDIGKIFRNICLSLGPGCSRKNLFLLWQHECFWVYGKQMVCEVDLRRFRQAFFVAVKKQFIDDEQIHAILKRRPPLFSNLTELDSGTVTAGLTDTNTALEEGTKTDLFLPKKSYSAVKELLEKGLDEYNKTHPRIKLALYKSVIEQICRLTRVIASPHEVANIVLVSEGCPARCYTIAKFMAFLCGFAVQQVTPTESKLPSSIKIEQFKRDLVSGYSKAGVKREKILLLLQEEDLADKDCLVFLAEFIISGDITHFFSQEEQTTIINSIRTDVTQAGLTYSRDVAWNFFLRTVSSNFRIVLITCGGSEELQYICREHSAFTKNVSFIWFPHWTKTQLVEHAVFHMKEMNWLTDIQKENIAHMLASLHLVLRQQDGRERTNGKYGHINNTSYEKFVERFISLANQKNQEVNKTHDAVTKILTQIRSENEAAIKLKKQLHHEIVVLEERKASTIKILSQIGQDTAITAQQIKIVRIQMEKITHLKKRLPEYQVAHERAVYKVIAIVADTKKTVKLMNTEELSELRAMQKPSPDIEDLLASIIMLLKSPSADLTWQKGAKRQMANLERFMEELTTFDDYHLPESTLVLVEAYLKKPSFDPETMEKKTGNSACGALCKWVLGVVRYHRMMISKVKPLHKKVEEMSQTVDSAQHKMNALEGKRKALEVRLEDLAKGFEEATIDKNEQEKKTLKMRKMLDTAAELRRILKGERQRCQQIFDSLGQRLLAIPGGCAMAAAFATYLGPYDHTFRRMMLTVHWPQCLREQGIPLVIDSVDSLKGRVVDWSFAFLKTASGASSIDEVDYASLIQNAEAEGDQKQDEDEEEDDIKDNEEKETVEKKNVTEGEGTLGPAADQFKKAEVEIAEAGTIPGVEEKDGENEDGHPVNNEEETKEASHAAEDATFEGEDMDYASVGIHGLPNIQEEPGNSAEDVRSDVTASTAPLLTSAQYSIYIKSLIKVLVGDVIFNKWLMKDLGPREIENAAILFTSWQRPPLLIDPNDEGMNWLTSLRKINKDNIVSLDTDNKSYSHIKTSLEQAISKGQQVVLKNSGNSVDSMTASLLYHHHNITNDKDSEEDPRMISFCGRHMTCHPSFQFYLSTKISKPHFSPTVASSVTLINFGLSRETLTEDLLTRAFAQIRPELYLEKKHALRNLQLQKDALYKFSEKVKDQVLSGKQEVMLSSPKALQAILSITEAKLVLASQLSNTRAILDDIDMLKDEFFPLARQASLLYSVMMSLAKLCPLYQFTLKYFLELFDEAIGGHFPSQFQNDSEEEDYEGEISRRHRAGTVGSQTTDIQKEEEAKQGTKNGEENQQTEEESNLEPDDAAESTSSTAVKQLFHGAESEDLPVIELPTVTALPTNGVEYTSYSKERIKILIDSVTSLVFHKINMSLFEADRLLFSTLLCLSMKVEAGEDITNEEMSFFLQGNPGLGMQLTLADFDCKASPPDWLSREKWEDILAFSVLPGPLDSICVDFAMHSQQWKEWHESPYPEKLLLPVGERKEYESGNNKQTPSGGGYQILAGDTRHLNDFHKLLILRLLRPDRLPSAFLAYTQQHLALINSGEEIFSVREVMESARKHWGVLVLLPHSPDTASAQRASRIKLMKSPVEEIMVLAKAVNIPVARTIVGDGVGMSVEEALNIADKNEGWAIIESIHLASSDLVRQLLQHLERIFKSRAATNLRTEKEEEASRFCIWLTSEPCDSLPSLLVQNLLKVSWNSVLSYPHTTKKSFENGNKTTMDMFSSFSSDSYLKAAIITSLHQIPKSTMDRLAEETHLTRRLVFGVAVLHAALVSRQLFGGMGLTFWYPFGTTQLLNAVEMVTTQMLCSEDKMQPSVDDLCYFVSNVIYGGMVSEELDKAYISALCSHIFKSIYGDSQILLGSVPIPLPPNSVATTDYADWFEQTVDRMMFQALQMNWTVEKQVNNCRSTQFLSDLSHMFDTVNEETSIEPPKTDHIHISIAKLRSALDICLEKLPPMLSLGDVDQFMKTEYDFPYHCPSIVSMSSGESIEVPQSVLYVLFQECLWMNTILCHIRQEIHDLQSNLVGGPCALPHRLLKTVYSLQEECVPVTWIHPQSQPCTHSLVSWLEDLCKRYQQFKKWVSSGIVPTVVNGQLSSGQTVARGRLTSVWLGGLVNPQALLTAFRNEKAVLEKVSLQDVSFECLVLSNIHPEEFEAEEGGLLVTDMILENGSWDHETNTLQEAQDLGYVHLQCIYLKPVGKPAHEEAKDGTFQSEVIHLPVYMNKSRQKQIWSLLVRSSLPERNWIQARTAFILDPGLPDEACKKSRAYLLLQKSFSVTPMGKEEETGEEEEVNKEYKDDDERETSMSYTDEESTKSQLSYRALSPQASPLPEGLGLHKEMPL